MNKINYETFWQGKWNDTTVFGPACRHRRRIIINLVENLPHERVLDLGCGDGSLLGELSRKIKTASLAGTDISREALSIARRNVPGIEFFQTDLNGKFTLDRRFDVIVLSEVLEHLENDESLLKQIAPLCRHVVISVPGGAPDKIDRRYGHVRNYSGRLISEKLARNGFDVVLHKRWGWPFYNLQQYLAYRPAMLPDARLASGEAGSVIGMQAGPENNADTLMEEGAYGPLRKLIARSIYALYFLNLPGFGAQVFAVGHSRMLNNSSKADNI